MPPARSLPATFASLRVRNYRLFASGQLVSNTGAWVQRIAQDWLVLTITGSATDVGITTALQFLPTLFFGLHGGAIADRYDKRQVLIATNIGMSSMAGILAVLTLSGSILPWHIFTIAFCLGLITAVDNPCRQAFVNELVGPQQLRNAISLNASIFQFGALIGPAISGYLINSVGAGVSFGLNCVTYIAPIIALTRIRRPGRPRPSAEAPTTRVIDAVHYARTEPAVLWTCVLAGVFGLFSINLPVTLAAYARSQFHSGPSGYGLLSSAVALGSVGGALIAARLGQTRLRGLVTFGALACTAITAASTAGTEWAFLVLLVAVGATTLAFLTTANSTVQLTATDGIRGRVMGIYLCVFVGSGAIGGPLVGAVDEHFGPRLGLLLAGLVPAAAIALVTIRLARAGHLRLRLRVRPSGRRGPVIAVVSR